MLVKIHLEKVIIRIQFQLNKDVQDVQVPETAKR